MMAVAVLAVKLLKPRLATMIGALGYPTAYFNITSSIPQTPTVEAPGGNGF
jgi:hypothetical protein